MMCCLKYFFYFSVIIQINSEFDLLRPKTVRLYQFKGRCPGYEKAPIFFRDIKLALVNRIHYISMKVVILRNISTGLKLQLTLNRCHSRDALDSCEKYQTINVNRLCDLINGENKPWSPLMKLMEPQITCPLKKGIYNVNNGTFDGSAFQYWPVSGWYWKIVAKVLDEETSELRLCMSMEGQLAPA